MPVINRESWLTAWIAVLRGVFAAAGAELPGRLRICCGGAVKRRVNARHWQLYGCWVTRNAADESCEILISASLDDSVEVCTVVATALVAVCTAGETNERYRCLAQTVGLAGGLSRPRPTELLKSRVHEFLREHGPYPHTAIAGPPQGYRPQPARRFRMVCGTCGVTAEMTARWIRSASLKCEECDRRLIVDPRDAARLAQPPRKRGRPRKHGSLSLAGRM
ncbi:MAG TPA: hypothetical protein VGM03_15335 [Phycisphaerae bacterium]|jgi:hypothetical protein